MKKYLLVTLLIFPFTTHAIEFYPYDKLENTLIPLEDNEKTSRLIYFSRSCDYGEFGSWDKCLALNGKIEDKDLPVGMCDYDNKFEKDNCLLLFEGSSAKFKIQLDRAIQSFVELHIFERFRKLSIDANNLGVDLTNAFEYDLTPLKIFLNSNGGSVDGALEIGKLVRKYQLEVIIGANDACVSSCFIIFMSGINRNISYDVFADNGTGSAKYDFSKLGVHKWYFENKEFSELPAEEASRFYRKKYREVEDYLESVGTPEFLISKINVTPSDEMFIFNMRALSDAIEDNRISIGDLFVDPVYRDRLKGSGLNHREFLFIEQFKAMYPDYHEKMRTHFRYYDYVLRKVYGENYWQEPTDDSEGDFSQITQKICEDLTFLPGNELVPMMCDDLN